MAALPNGRPGAHENGDCVVFLIGACLDLRHPLRGLLEISGRRGVRDVLAYVAAESDRGLLGYDLAGFTVTQWWRTIGHLDSFAGDGVDPRLAPWRNYWKRVARSSRTSIWHETYLVRAGQYQPVYGHVPAFVRPSTAPVRPAVARDERMRLEGAAG